ncbi:MAG: carboxylating nicotinate-nucleotide diphosphorylase [Helicobacteraceae bacterium]|nr:carboxylating nicotinate-nucleotide diphosphorylase [Helicobacteraceae bacterium]
MIKKFVEATLAEDVGRGDLYSLISKATPTTAKVIAKSDGVLAGVKYIEVLAELENFNIEFLKDDAQSFIKGDILLKLSGDSHTILKIERTLLNILHHASSIATLTKKYVDLIDPYGVKLLDTRKTRPLLRVFEKYATRIGGATNHRLGLDDCLMLKDTHLKTITNLEEYIKNARKKIPFTSKIEIEAETYEQAVEFMRVGADIVMCDNMDHSKLKRVVEFRDRNFQSTLLEASGNISLDTIESYAKCGVDAISSGSLIHQANWIDLSMKVD